ncbi:hypothetical protein OK016_00225 [Vibrio chagasii]|nr:hypothetical protein [Vibrio chagasii]
MTVTPSNGATITIADGATSGTTTVPASDDVYVGGDTASATITDATGGNFESLVKDPTAATTTINDDQDVTSELGCQRMRQSPKARTSPHIGDTNELCGMAR